MTDRPSPEAGLKHPLDNTGSGPGRGPGGGPHKPLGPLGPYIEKMQQTLEEIRRNVDGLENAAEYTPVLESLSSNIVALEEIFPIVPSERS